MTPQSAKAKGRRLQQWVRDRIVCAFRLLLEPDDVKSTSMGAPGEDIQLSPLARRLFPYSVECKNLKRIAVFRDYEQCAANAARVQFHNGKAIVHPEPLLVLKENNADPLVLISFEHFMELTKRG